jgi:hypothetical protein
MTLNNQSISLLAEALQARRFLLVWADVPFPPEDRPPRSPARTIHRWQEDACALPLLPFDFAHGKPWPLVDLPPLSIFSLDPSERVENAFRYAGVPLHVVRTRRDAPARDQHNLFKLGGDLVARAGLFFSWDDARAASSDLDKAYLLEEIRRLVQDGAVLALAPSPSVALVRLWDKLLAPALKGARHQFVLGPAGFAWPAPLVRLEGEFEELLAALAERVIPPPLEPVQARLDSLRRQLAEERENLLLIGERKAKFVMSASVPLHLVKEERRLRKRIAELEAEFGSADALT